LRAIQELLAAWTNSAQESGSNGAMHIKHRSENFSSPVGAKIDPGWQLFAGHIAFLLVLTVRPDGRFPRAEQCAVPSFPEPTGLHALQP